MASVRTHSPRSKARSTIRTSPTMPPWRAKNPGLVFAQCAHHLKALDRGVRRLQRLEPAHGPDQQLELAVVDLYDVVEVLHQPLPCLCRTFPLSLQLRDGSGKGRHLISVEHLGLLLSIAIESRSIRSCLWSRGCATAPGQAPGRRRWPRSAESPAPPSGPPRSTSG